MMVEREELGLSLSLNFSAGGDGSAGGGSKNGGGCSNRNQSSSGFQLNLMPSIVPSTTHSPPPPPASMTASMMTGFPNSAPPHHFFSHLHKSHWTDNASFPCSSDRNSDIFRPTAASEPRTFLRGIDVNRLPATTGDEEDLGVSSPNSTVSSISGKRSEREATHGGSSEENEMERACSRGMSDEEDGENSRKKLRLSKDQSAILEESFKEHNTLNPKQKLALAKRLGLRPRQVEVWFQNRRARTKLKQTEVDCEFLKRCCEQLTEENRRLQKEVQELRALKLSPQFYMQMTPPTTLTMCPSCERVAAPPSSSTSSASAQHHHQQQQQQQPGPSSSVAAPTAHRPMPINPWASAPVPIRPFDALQPRS